jgi:hypothetical protein
LYKSFSKDTDIARTEDAPDDNRIIYKLHLTDISSNPSTEMNRYSWTPFKGLLNKNEPDLDRESLSVMDFSRHVRGYPLRKRRTQIREKFGTTEDKDPEEFAIGVDFVVSSKKSEKVRIFSPYI